MATAVGRHSVSVSRADRLSRVIGLSLDLFGPVGPACGLRAVGGGGSGRG